MFLDPDDLLALGLYEKHDTSPFNAVFILFIVAPVQDLMQLRPNAGLGGVREGHCVCGWTWQRFDSCFWFCLSGLRSISNCCRWATIATIQIQNATVVPANKRFYSL